jgi:hypothetical protein
MGHKYDPLIERLEGLRAWCIKTSIGGMTIEFGEDQGSAPPLETGEWTVWVQTRMRIVAARKVILDTDYPLEEQEDTVSQYIDGQTVTRAGIDPLNNSLRLLFGTDTLLSVFPSTRADDLPWMLFNNRSAPTHKLIVYSDGFEGDLAVTE